MTEILTESFCERCGTRYTFESARPRVRLKGVRVLSRGLKNFVLSDDNSIDEAMAAARSETDRELTAHQLDAFHKTFNFCMSCRQYTCPNCWNEAEARCLSCAPHLGQEVMPAPFPDLAATSYLVAEPAEAIETNGWNGSNGSNGAAHEPLIGDTLVQSVEPPAATVDVTNFAARLQALTAPPSADQPVEQQAPAETEAASATRVNDVGVAEVAEPAAVEAEIPVGAPAQAEVETVAAAETLSEIPYVVGAAAVSPDDHAGVQPVGAEPEAVAAAEVEFEPEAVAAAEVEFEPEGVAATEVEPAATMVVAADAETDEEAQIAARLAAFASAAAVVQVSRDDQAPSIAEKGVAQTGGLLRRFRAGQDLDAELDAYEREHAAAVVPADAEPAAVQPEEAPVAETTIADSESEIADIAAAATVAELEIIEPEAVAAEPAVENIAAAATVAEPEIIEPKAVAVEPAVEDIAAAAAAITAEPEIETVPAAALASESDSQADAEPEVEVVAAASASAAAAIVAEPEIETVPAVAPATEPETQAAAAVAAEAERAAPIDDVIAQPTWQIVAPDPAVELPPAPPAAPAPTIPTAATRVDPASEPQWPTRPEWPDNATAAGGLPFLNRPPTPTGGLEALWAESAREVVASPAVPGRPAATGGVQPCVSCGLSLSATARFCRRCGTPQAV